MCVTEACLPFSTGTGGGGGGGGSSSRVLSVKKAAGEEAAGSRRSVDLIIYDCVHRSIAALLSTIAPGEQPRSASLA